MTPPPPTPVPGRDVVPFYWIKMEVSNLSRRSKTAKKVEIYVDSIYRKNSLNKFEKREIHHGFNICWSWGEFTTFADILPSSAKFIHIGHLTRNDVRYEIPNYRYQFDQSAQNDALMVLAAYPRNSEFDYILEPGTYKLSLVVGGKNFETSRHWITLAFEKPWSDDPSLMRSSVAIEVPSTGPD